MKRKVIMVAVIASCLIAALFLGATTSGGPTYPSVTSASEYDPWKDLDDNGVINILDILSIAIIFGAEGEPINKTALLLGLQESIDSLNYTMETRIPRTGTISVPAAAFVPRNDKDKDWRNYGNYLANFEATGIAYFYASVQLPHGAIIQGFTSCWFDDGNQSLSCLLVRNNLTLGVQTMAYTSSPGTEAPGYGSTYDDTIDFATVDNNEFVYLLTLGIRPPPTDYRFQYAFIEYEYPA